MPFCGVVLFNVILVALALPGSYRAQDAASFRASGQESIIHKHQCRETPFCSTTVKCVQNENNDPPSSRASRSPSGCLKTLTVCTFTHRPVAERGFAVHYKHLTHKWSAHHRPLRRRAPRPARIPSICTRQALEALSVGKGVGFAAGINPPCAAGEKHLKLQEYW